MSFATGKLSPLTGTTTFRCRANGLLPTTYSIIFNGTYFNDVNNGVKIIKIVTINDAGLYKCIAANIIGNSAKELTLNTRGEEEKTTSRPFDATSNTTGKDKYRSSTFTCDIRCSIIVSIPAMPVALGL